MSIGDVSKPLLDGNLLDGFGLLGLFLLGDMDVQHAVFHLGFDLLGLGILRQQERLLELLVGESERQLS